MTDRAESTASRRRCVRGDETGAALLEFSLVFALFVFILYGLITFGVILAQKQAVTAAASDAARSAVGTTTQAAAVTAAQTRVQKALGAPNGRYSETYTYAPCSGGTGVCLTVKITWDYAGHPLVPKAPGIGLVTPDSFGATAVVQVS